MEHIVNYIVAKIASVALTQGVQFAFSLQLRAAKALLKLVFVGQCILNYKQLDKTIGFALFQNNKLSA